MHRTRRPVELAQGIDHRASNADAGKGFKAGAAVLGVVGSRLQQTQHSSLDQVVDLDGGRQATGQMVSNALDELRMARHQLIGISVPALLGVGANCAH